MLEEGARKAGGVAAFCAACQTPKTSYHFWTGNGKRRAEFITWDTWERVRDALAQLRLLDPADPRWMLPSELRAEVLRLRDIVAAGSPTTISAGDGAAVANGSHASAQATTPSPAEERAAERLDRLAAWILASSLSPDEKLAALSIAHG
ncbi:MAG: hypothetical protein ACI4WT_03210 [Oligosphaeraceae bacterium]